MSNQILLDHRQEKPFLHLTLDTCVHITIVILIQSVVVSCWSTIQCVPKKRTNGEFFNFTLKMTQKAFLCNV